MEKSIIIIGAGIVGVSTAIWLQRAGYQVTLVDKEGPAGRELLKEMQVFWPQAQ